MNASIKVLLIEDNPGDARLMRELLVEEKGGAFHLECIDRLSAGIERLTSGKVDVVLLDLGLPDSQGFDTFTKVHNSLPKIPIVILSGLTDEALAARAVREGAQDYLVKGHVDSNLLGRSLRYAIERKQVQVELQKYRDHLEELVSQRTAELVALNKELESFSYSVSHDLRAPLRAIDGFSRILLEDYTDKIDDEGKRLLNIVRNNTQKMSQLIDDLLAFSRVGRQEIRHSNIDMDKLAKTLFKELKLTVPERELQFNVKTPPAIHGDQAMIRQVFVNLLSNSIKFTRPKENAIIEVGGSNEADENVYYVKDNGVGFDMRYVNKLFGVFQRLHNSEEFEGTGVGLAIVERIIHRHGGRVWAEGEVGKGATFYFTLPRGTREERR
jgi:signal transduction histidine kinase